MLNLAECQQKTGKLASAWATFRTASGFAKEGGDNERAKFAGARAAALEPKLAKLTVSVSTATTKIPGLAITRGEVTVAPEEFNLPVALDAGTYTMRATAPGRIAWSKDVSIVGEGTRFLVTVPELVVSEEPAPAPVPTPAPTPVEPTPAPAPTPTPAPVTPQPRAAEPPAISTWSPQKTVAIGAGVAGIVALGGGVFFAVQSGSKSSTADAHDATTASLVAFVASGLLLGSGALLYFTSPKATRTTALRVTPGGLALDGAF